MVAKRAQFQIQQMAFMIVAVVIFFVLVGMFFLVYQSRNLQGNYEQLQKDEAISSLSVLANIPELSCGSLCLDLDKVEVMANKDYSDFWALGSVKVYQVYPESSSIVKCPAPNCNYWEVYDSGQKNIKEYSTFVSVCRKKSEQGSVYDQCEIGKLVLGVEE